MRRQPLRLIGVIVVVATGVWSCYAGAVVPKSNRYASEVDGVAAGWPDGWERVDKRLTTFTGGAVDLLALATFDPPATTDLGCAQHAAAAIAAMREGDAFFRLQTVRHLIPDRPVGAKPASFMVAAEPVEWAGGCKPQEVVALRVAFEEYGRLYQAELIARSPLSDALRDDLDTIWAALDVGPIATGLHSAEQRRRYWHEISTHCGITDTTFDGRDWVADPALVGGGDFGPPAGWENPTEIGTIRLESEDSALFESRDRERSADFRPRVADDPPPRPCE